MALCELSQDSSPTLGRLRLICMIIIDYICNITLRGLSPRSHAWLLSCVGSQRWNLQSRSAGSLHADSGNIWEHLGFPLWYAVQVHLSYNFISDRGAVELIAGQSLCFRFKNLLRSLEWTRKANTDRSYSTSSFSFSLYLIYYIWNHIYIYIYFFKVYILHSHQGIAQQRIDVIVPAAVRRFPEVDGSADTFSVQIP